jgi:glycosyltransferase involved in cell wall biosynthesis
MQPVRVAVVTNVIPHYRQSFYDEIFARPELDLTIFCQAEILGMNLRTVHGRFADRVRLVRSWGTARERFGWQHLPWRELLSGYDVLFVYSNPRVLSNLCFASWAAVRGKSVVLWGPARSAGGGGLGARLRLLWWRGFRSLFVYTDQEVAWLRERGFKRQEIVGMNNGLDQRAIDRAASLWNPADLHQWRLRQGLGDRPMLLSCARLEPKNDFACWLTAMPAVLRAVPDLLWCVIGQGPQEDRLRAQAVRLGIADQVLWLGTILDENAAAPWFLNAAALMHPSAVGLSLLHAYGYGLPAITHDDPTAQMAEYAAFTSGETGLSYRRGDPDDLARVTIGYLTQPELRQAFGATALRVARERYNVSVMADRFIEFAMRVAPSTRVSVPAAAGNTSPPLAPPSSGARPPECPP